MTLPEWAEEHRYAEAGRVIYDPLLNKAQGIQRVFQSWNIEPTDLYSNTYTESLLGSVHPGTKLGMSFELLARMSRVPLISAIIGARVNQVADHAVPGERLDQPLPGFMLRLRDKTKSPTRAERKAIQTHQSWLMTCGDPRAHDEMVTFEGFLRAITFDTMRYDQACFEVLPRRYGKGPGAFIAVDAATIRRSQLSKEERKRGRRAPGKVPYVQIVEDKIRATYHKGELGFGIRRPRTDLDARGYGHPELEELVGTVTSLVNAEMFNTGNFRHGVHTAGVLAIMSAMNRETWNLFKRGFYAMLSGAENAHKLPLIQLNPEKKESMKFEGLGRTNREMEFSQWISWLLRVACAVFQIDPSELGYQYGNENQTSTLGSSDPAQRRMDSRERGLRPLLRAISSWINNWLVWPYYPELEFVFVGLDGQSDGDKRAAAEKEVKTVKTLNEVRAEWDKAPLPTPIADMPLDPTYVNAMVQLIQAGIVDDKGKLIPAEERQDAQGAPEEGNEGEEAPEEDDGEEGAEEAPEEDDDDDKAPEIDLDALFAKSKLFAKTGGGARAGA